MGKKRNADCGGDGTQNNQESLEFNADYQRNYRGKGDATDNLARPSDTNYPLWRQASETGDLVNGSGPYQPENLLSDKNCYYTCQFQHP